MGSMSILELTRPPYVEKRKNKLSETLENVMHTITFSKVSDNLIILGKKLNSLKPKYW